MIGVTLWSSASKEKAVIWCEDHAALAYLQGRDNLAPGNVWPEAGDLVELECETIEVLRHARNVSLVSGIKRSELPSLLSEMGQGTSAGQPVLRVISNSAFPGKSQAPDKIAVA
jgi:hypothetical protein